MLFFFFLLYSYSCADTETPIALVYPFALDTLAKFVLELQ